jgi:ABC-type amino acid transport substrate-binding protein
MSGLLTTPERALEMTLIPYLEETLGFVVADHRRERFASWEALQDLPRPRIAVPRVTYFRSFLTSRLPRAVVIEIDAATEFFQARPGTFDALLLTAESGSAWALVDPRYAVVVPRPDPVRVQAAYAVPRDARDLAGFVGTWVELKKRDGALARFYDHWVLGKGATDREPRWSVLRNVLRWGE